ncbi:MAG: hypothetical protein SH809_02555 [Rhodothermales bacterium]|nr:hypothetical protein [Rhodothermales bacterium]
MNNHCSDPSLVAPINPVEPLRPSVTLNPNGRPASEPYCVTIDDLYARLRVVRGALAYTIEDVLNEVHAQGSNHSDAFHLILFSLIGSFDDVLREMEWAVGVAQADGSNWIRNEAWRQRR